MSNFNQNIMQIRDVSVYNGDRFPFVAKMVFCSVSAQYNVYDAYGNLAKVNMEVGREYNLPAVNIKAADDSTLPAGRIAVTN